ncbi:MAG: signal peptidase II [Lachnospiraceae bacterium]|nr:signal peptidase II [Lachnospiraceae bacterium]
MNKKMQVLLAAIAGVGIVALDQVTKWWAENTLVNGSIPFWKDVFELHLVHNTGAAFGILKGNTPLLLALPSILVLALLYLYAKAPADSRMRPLRLVFLCLAAGGIGNLIDRFRLGFVVDFLYFKLIDFPVFNVADIFATVSSFLLVFLLFFFYKEEDLTWLFPGEKRV